MEFARSQERHFALKILTRKRSRRGRREGRKEGRNEGIFYAPHLGMSSVKAPEGSELRSLLPMGAIQCENHYPTIIDMYCTEVHLSFSKCMNENCLNAGEWTFTEEMGEEYPEKIPDNQVRKSVSHNYSR